MLQNGASAVLTLGASEEESLITVPDLIGLTAAEANRLLVDQGFNIAIGGAKDYFKVDKTVMGQFPAAGTVLSVGAVVTVYFPYEEKRE